MKWRHLERGGCSTCAEFLSTFVAVDSQADLCILCCIYKNPEVNLDAKSLVQILSQQSWLTGQYELQFRWFLSFFFFFFLWVRNYCLCQRRWHQVIFQCLQCSCSISLTNTCWYTEEKKILDDKISFSQSIQSLTNREFVIRPIIRPSE